MPLFAFKKAERWRTYRQSPHDLNHRRPCARVGLDSPANDQPPKNASVESSPSTQRIHNTPKTGVFVADTYKMWRDALAVVINGAPDLQVTGEAATGDEAVSLCRRMRPDIVVMSIELEGLGGIDVTQQIMRERPDTKVILI